MDHPAVRRMVTRETLIRDAAEVDAALILCDLKWVRLTPAKPRVLFAQRETVLLLTGLYGLTKLIKKFVTLPKEVLSGTNTPEQ